MSNPVLSYSAANSLLGALRQRRFTPLMIRELTGTIDLQDCLTRLHEQMPGLDIPQNLDSGVGQTLRQVERALLDYYHEGSRKLIRFLPAAAANLLRSFLTIYDFGLLKRIFRLWAFPDFNPSGDMESNLHSKPGFFIPLDRIPLSSTTNIAAENLLDIVRGTPLRTPMKKALDQYRRKPFLYYFEIVLDSEYLKLLAEAATNLLPSEEEEVRNCLLDHYIGFKEFSWSLRMRFYHQMDATEIDYFLPLASECFSRSHLQAVMKPTTEKDSIAALPAGHLASFLFQDESRSRKQPGPSTIEDLDILGNHRLYLAATRKQINRPFTLTRFLSFIISQKLLMENMVAVFQAKRFAIELDELQSVLVYREESVS